MHPPDAIQRLIEFGATHSGIEGFAEDFPDVISSRKSAA